MAPEFERKSPKHQKSESNDSNANRGLSINREEKKEEEIANRETNRMRFEIAQKKREGDGMVAEERMKEKERISQIQIEGKGQDYNISLDFRTEKNKLREETLAVKLNPLMKSKSANCVEDNLMKPRQETSPGGICGIKEKQRIFHNIVRESCVLEEEDMLKKEEKDLLRMSFYLENKAEEIAQEQTDEKQEEDVPGLAFYRHNTFINSIKMLEKSQDNDFVIEEDESKLNELLRAITHYKVLTVEIEKHLNNPRMVLCSLKEKYVDYYTNKYDQIIKEKEKFVGRDDLYDQVIDAAFEDLKDFIEVFHQAIYYFYKIQYLDQRILIEKSFFKPENIHNFLTSILLDREIYSILYLSLIQSQEDKEDSLRLALQFCRSLQPRDFEIPAKYCLDHNTLACHSKVQLESLSLSQEFGSETSSQSVPYESAIKCLQEIEFVRSPLHKLKVLVRTGDLILQSVEEFYRKHDLQYCRDSLCADDLLPIFTYVVAKSQVKCFYSQIKIIDELASRNLKNTLSGYYFVTLQIALGLIERCFKNEVQKINEKQEENDFKKVEARTSFAENMGAKLSAIKENNPKKSIFGLIKDL